MSVKTFSLAANGDASISNNFKVKEFRCKDGSDKILIDVDFIKNKLQAIRDFVGGSITITSGYRTESYNKKVGGATHSYHVKGQAFDIVPHGKTLDEICRFAESIGVLGIIKYPNSGFVHVDSRTSKYFSNNSGKSACNTFGHISVPAPSATVPAQNNNVVPDRPGLKGDPHLYDLQGALTDDGIPTKKDGLWGTESATNVGKVSINPNEFKFNNVVAWCQCRWNFTDESLDGKYGAKESVPACNDTRRRHGLPETGILDGSVIISILRDVGVQI